MDYDEREMRRGRFNPAALAIGALVVIGGGAALAYGIKSESERPNANQIAGEQKQLYVLPRAEQLPAWHTRAASGTPELVQEALLQMFLLNDPETASYATKALASTDHRVRGVAAQVLAGIGKPGAEQARGALMQAFKESDPNSDQPQVAWALVALNEKSLFPDILALYKKGELSTIERPGGGRAFDVEQFSQMASPEEWNTLAGDENESVRQLAAGILSRTGDKKYTQTLIKLVNDPKNDVAREAASGLGRIGDPAAMKPLLDALTRADKDDRQRFLEALRDGIGGEGLVLALTSVARDKANVGKFQTKQIFDMLRTLADPRATEALAKYVASNPPIHWKTEAALRLAEVGDVRAVPALGERLRLDPTKVYDAKVDPEYMRDDNERVVSARMLADLAVLHPGGLGDAKAQAEDAALFWAKDLPQPHANALRFLAASGSQKALPAMREWANPTAALPKEGASGAFPPEFATASSALRYVGWAKDTQSWGLLEKQLTRKDPKYDISEAGLVGAGLSMVGMVLRGLAVGSSQGFAQWGDARAYPIMVKFIEDPKQNEGARQAACESLPWVATDEQMREVVKKAKDAAANDPKTQVLRACYLESITRRPVEGTGGTLLAMLDKSVDSNVRHRVARAIGWLGVDAATEKALFDKLGDQELRTDAALSLLLGGSEEAAGRAVAQFNNAPKEQLDFLKELYYESFGYWSDDDLAKGRLYRWVANAEAVGRVKVNDSLQEWARLRLGAQFANLEFDNGPHSMTRVVLRSRLIATAKSNDAAARKGAINTLKFMKEQGSLMALRDVKGETGTMAGRALFELLNPRGSGGETVPEKKPASATP